MARNEEKQLARLNRFYLQQQKDEELKKRPPRPKLESLTTAEDVKKWIPSIIKDIEFYVKQMEVPCYRDRQIEEFNRRVDSLRGEYRAFLRKVRQLDHTLDANPWTDRPYSGKRRKTAVANTDNSAVTPKAAHTNLEACGHKDLSISFTPIATPVLDKISSFTNFYGYGKPVEVLNDIEDQSQNQPLQLSLAPASKSKPPTRLLTSKQDATTTSHLMDGEYKPNNSALPSRGDDNPTDSRLNSQSETSEQEHSTELQVSRLCDCKAGACSQRECVKSLQHLNKEAGEEELSVREKVAVALALNLPYTDSSSSDES